MITSTINATSLFVQWSFIHSNMTNGPIISYNVKVFEVESNSTFSLLNISILNLTISNLHPYYHYQLFVAGSTIIGTGPFAQSECQTQAAG